MYLASTFIQEKVYDKFAKQNYYQLICFVRDAVGNSFVSAIRGKLFEEYAHRRLCSGEDFRVRSLDDSDSGEDRIVNFGKLTPKHIACVNDIEAGYYCRPIAKNFKSIDSLIAPDTLFQITVAEQHPIKENGIAMLRSKLKTRGTIAFYFVVPPDGYRGLKRQSYTIQEGMYWL